MRREAKRRDRATFDQESWRGARKDREPRSINADIEAPDTMTRLNGLTSATEPSPLKDQVEMQTELEDIVSATRVMPVVDRVQMLQRGTATCRSGCCLQQASSNLRSLSMKVKLMFQLAVDALGSILKSKVSLGCVEVEASLAALPWRSFVTGNISHQDQKILCNEAAAFEGISCSVRRALRSGAEER